MKKRVLLFIWCFISFNLQSKLKKTKYVQFFCLIVFLCQFFDLFKRKTTAIIYGQIFLTVNNNKTIDHIENMQKTVMRIRVNVNSPKKRERAKIIYDLWSYSFALMINLNQNFWFISFNLAAILQSKYAARAKPKATTKKGAGDSMKFQQNNQRFVCEFRVYYTQLGPVFSSFRWQQQEKTGWIKSNVTTTVARLLWKHIWIHKLNYHRRAAEFCFISVYEFFFLSLHFDP